VSGKYCVFCVILGSITCFAQSSEIPYSLRVSKLQTLIEVAQYFLIYIQQEATLHSLFYLETALHVSGGTITHHQERKQLYLQHLVFSTPLLLSAAIVEELEAV
jgi:hypothetical protein